jgi:hypothetical protein
LNDNDDHDNIYEDDGLEDNIGTSAPSYLNKSGLSFPSDMNTTNSYEAP